MNETVTVTTRPYHSLLFANNKVLLWCMFKLDKIREGVENSHIVERNNDVRLVPKQLFMTPEPLWSREVRKYMLALYGYHGTQVMIPRILKKNYNPKIIQHDGSSCI